MIKTIDYNQMKKKLLKMLLIKFNQLNLGLSFEFKQFKQAAAQFKIIKIYDTFFAIQNSEIHIIFNKMQKQPRSFSNQIMIGYDDLDKPKTIYLPAYLSAKINNIESFQVSESIGTINLTLYMLIYFGDLKKQFVDRCCEQIELGPSRDDQFRLKLSKKIKKQVKQQEQAEAQFQSKQQQQEEQQQAVNIVQKNFDEVRRTKTFIIRKSFEASLIPYPHFTPFEIHDLNLYFQTRKITLPLYSNNGKEEKQNIQVKINFMSTYRFDTNKRFKCLNFTQTGSFGQYDLAQGFLMYQNPSGRPTKTLNELFQYFPFSKTGKKQVFQQQKNSLSKMECEEALKYMMTYLQNKNFQYASFHFPMYRKPLVSFITIFLPLWALSFITLSLYFSGNSYAKRVIAIATLNLAFVPTVQLVRQSIPQTPSLTLVEVFIYLQIISTCILLLESNKISGNTSFVFEPLSDMYFLASLALSAIVFVLPIIFYIIFWVIERTKFNIQINDSSNKQQIDIEDSNDNRNKKKKYTNNRDLRKQEEEQQKNKENKNKVESQQAGFKFNVLDWNYNQAANHFFYEKKRIYSVCSDIESKIEQLKQQRNRNFTNQISEAQNKDSYSQSLNQGKYAQLKTIKEQKEEEKISKFKTPYKYFTSESSKSFEYKILINAINNRIITQEDQQGK